MKKLVCVHSIIVFIVIISFLLGCGGGLGAIAIALLPQLAHVRDRIAKMFYVEYKIQMIL